MHTAAAATIADASILQKRTVVLFKRFKEACCLQGTKRGKIAEKSLFEKERTKFVFDVSKLLGVSRIDLMSN